MDDIKDPKNIRVWPILSRTEAILVLDIVRGIRDTSETAAGAAVALEAALGASYNPDYGDGRLCRCGQPYAAHFDEEDRMEFAPTIETGCWEFEAVE